MNSRQSQRQQLHKDVKNKKKPKKTAEEKAKSNLKDHENSPIPVDLQQLVLNIFKDSFSTLLETNFQPLLQEVKGHLYERNFLTAFGRTDYLETYATRWSPSRALGYLQVLAQLDDVSTLLKNSTSEAGKVVCIGGGAGAEIAALGGFLNFLQRTRAEGEKPTELEVVAIDIADWTSVIGSLQQNITRPPPLSKYASAAAQKANAALADPRCFTVKFLQQDVLHSDLSGLDPALEEATLVTIMFTLNELYSTSLALTQKFLLYLTDRLPAGTILLVIDSPGSYSSVTLNGAERKYPMQWLLDHTLLKDGDNGPWTKLVEDESRWFRLDDRLRYPIELENMRMQLHLYRRLA